MRRWQQHALAGIFLKDVTAKYHNFTAHRVPEKSELAHDLMPLRKASGFFVLGAPGSRDKEKQHDF
jgi:hypothetical protein